MAYLVLELYCIHRLIEIDGHDCSYVTRGDGMTRNEFVDRILLLICIRQIRLNDHDQIIMINHSRVRGGLGECVNWCDISSPDGH